MTSSRSLWLVKLGVVVLTGCAAIPASAKDFPFLRGKKPTAQQQQADVSMGRLCESQGNTAKAREIYLAIVKANPKCAEAWHRLGVLSGKEGNLEEAATALDRAVEGKPNDAAMLADRSYVHYLMSRFDQAEADIRASLKMDPRNERAQVNLAMILGAQGRMDESYQAFRRVMNESEAASNVAYFYLQQGDAAQVKAYYTKAVELNSENRKAAQALVKLYKMDQEASLAARKQKSRTAVAGAQRTTPIPTQPQGAANRVIQVSAEEPAVTRPAPVRAPSRLPSTSPRARQ